MKRKTVIATAALLAGTGIFIWAFWKELTVRHYMLETGAANGVCIVLLTDLHATIYGGNQDRLIELVKKQQPDLIFYAGDIADDQVPFEGTRLLLEGLQGVAPAYYVTGNHEYYNGDCQDTKEQFELYGVRVLEDEYEIIEVNGRKLLVAGVEDPLRERVRQSYHWARSMDGAFGGLTSEDGIYKILLAHRPERFSQYAKYPFDLVLSGHAHGGQVRIPLLLNGLFAPNQGFFPKYAGGLYDRDGITHIVSRGLSINPNLPRIFNPPEVVVINLK